MTDLKPCPHCGTLGSTGCDDQTQQPGYRGRSNLCFQREIANLKAEIAALKAKLKELDHD